MCARRNVHNITLITARSFRQLWEGASCRCLLWIFFIDCHAHSDSLKFIILITFTQEVYLNRPTKFEVNWTQSLGGVRSNMTPCQPAQNSKNDDFHRAPRPHHFPKIHHFDNFYSGSLCEYSYQVWSELDTIPGRSSFKHDPLSNRPKHRKWRFSLLNISLPVHCGLLLQESFV